MSENIFSRTIPLIGEKAMQKLENSTVCLFGIGGVGSYAFEALVRAGVGNLEITDYAKVDESNINRQLIALLSTIGKYKTQVAGERAATINPKASVVAHNVFVDEKSIEECIPEKTDYIIDAIDTVASKILLIEYAKENSIPIISCMGTGNKLHPELLRISDIYKTTTDPLARVMRSELKKREIRRLDVVWSDEIPVVKGENLPLNKEGKKVPASISYVPSAAGILLASYVVNALTGNK